MGYPVFKFISGNKSIDGDVEYFWSPKFGIILIKSSTWLNYNKLWTSDDESRNEINELIEMIFLNNDFYITPHSKTKNN